MDIATAASFFDDQPVQDAYSGITLFKGQPDLFDLTKSDSAAGFRRTISSADWLNPARGCVEFGGDVYLTGRVVRDFAGGDNVRAYAILHPVDGLVTYGTPLSFLDASVSSSSAFAAESWLKDRKFETEGSELRPEYTYYMHPSEGVSSSMILKDDSGVYFRVQSVSRQTGGLLAVTTFDLGADALKTVSFISSGAYDPVLDSSVASAPIAVPAFVEFFRASYRFPNNASAKFERSDSIVTLAKAVVSEPKPVDTLVVDGKNYRVLERLDDSNGCWSLHVRPEL